MVLRVLHEGCYADAADGFAVSVRTVPNVCTGSATGPGRARGRLVGAWTAAASDAS